MRRNIARNGFRQLNFTTWVVGLFLLTSGSIFAGVEVDDF